MLTPMREFGLWNDWGALHGAVESIANFCFPSGPQKREGERPKKKTENAMDGFPDVRPAQGTENYS